MAVHLVTNPTAGAGRASKRLDAVRRRLAERDTVVPVEVDRPGEVGPTLGRLARAGALERVVCAGGDGMVHLCAQGLAHTDVPVGIIPVGTGNDIARALGLPGDVDAAVDAALGDPVALDLIEHDGTYAVSVLTAGFSGDVNARANSLSFPKGQQRYTLATLLELGRLKPRALLLDVDGERHELEVSMLAVGNTAFFGGGMKICPDADPTDGVLEVVTVDAIGPARLARFLPTVFSGNHVDRPEVRVLRGRQVTITALPPIEAWADGEFVGPLTSSLTVAPGALAVASARPDGGSQA